MTDRVGIVASCFDLFHAGHVLMLYEAKQHCDRLVVALQSDPTIDRPEKNKPIQGLFERFVQVESCEYVDQVVPYDTEADLYNMLAGYDWSVRFLERIMLVVQTSLATTCTFLITTAVVSTIMVRRAFVNVFKMQLLKS